MPSRDGETSIAFPTATASRHPYTPPGRSLRVLLEPNVWTCCFFSTAEARRVFNIQSRWATEDEWFAIDRIPAGLVGMHCQLAHGALNGSPYQLVPVHRDRMPRELVDIPIMDFGELFRKPTAWRSPTEGEEDGLWRTASEAAERGLDKSISHNEFVYQELRYGDRSEWGSMHHCVHTQEICKAEMERKTRVLVLPLSEPA